MQQQYTVNELMACIGRWQDSGAQLSYLPAQRMLCMETKVNGKPLVQKIQLPVSVPALHGEAVSDLAAQLAAIQQTYVIILVQAGYAALGMVETGILTRHKMIKKYMVRQNQGKAQVKHLKTRGKSRVGSRIRLKNTVSFFEEINELLIDWRVAEKSETILMSLPVNMKNLFYNANVPTPFSKRDPRIKKIPMDIKRPSFKELQHVHWVVSRGTI